MQERSRATGLAYRDGSQAGPGRGGTSGSGGQHQSLTGSLDSLRVARRWQRWAHLCSEQRRAEHAAWYERLVRAGVSHQRIERGDWDDPRLSAGDRSALLKVLSK